MVVTPISLILLGLNEMTMEVIFWVLTGWFVVGLVASYMVCRFIDEGMRELPPENEWLERVEID